MPDHVVCFAVDEPYTLPALASAIQLRRMLPATSADVAIFCIEPNDRTKRDFATPAAREGILLHWVPRRLLDGRSGLYANLFLDRFVPDCYSQITYVDADIQFRHSIETLVGAAVPHGSFLAVPDPMAFDVDSAGSRGMRLSRYMQGLGLDVGQRRTYFNSGVLRIDRCGWGEIGAEAVRFLDRWPGRCLFADQSALNAASAGRYTPISLRWNFPTFLRNAGWEASIEPAAYHFMSQPKPWQGVYPPWNASFAAPYTLVLREYPWLASYLEGHRLGPRIRYAAQQWLKRGWEAVVWCGGIRRERILHFEQGAALDGQRLRLLPPTDAAPSSQFH